MLYEVLEIYNYFPGDGLPVNENKLVKLAEKHCKENADEYDDGRRELLPINTKEKAITYFENYGFKINKIPETLADLTKEQLNELRDDISLCSIFYSDYENRFGLNRCSVSAFFDGYADYLGELMQEDGHNDADFFDLLPKYDNPENLYNYYAGIEWQ